jgi:Ser/Thr protein kinase RdoA (MazF antagonist)
MDDAAGGGTRGRRPERTAELAAAVAAAYGLDLAGAVDLGGGLNLNLLVRDERRGGLVVRVYRNNVGADRLAAVQHVRTELAASGPPCAVPVTARDGSTSIRVGDHLVEVEHHVPHDGRMNTAGRLRRGLPYLGKIHSVLRSVDVAPAGRAARLVNHIEPDQVRAGTALGTARIRSWQPTVAELRLADRSDRLAQEVAAGEAGLVADLPRQVVHGDFWDNNVYFRGEDLVSVADFDFMGERTRIDDLALTLYFADCQFGHTDTASRIAALRPLVAAYASGLDVPLSTRERRALPWALARQPLWGIGGWVVTLDDPAHARRHAVETACDVDRALQVVAEVDRWSEAFA